MSALFGSLQGIGGLLILLLVIYGIIFYVPIIQDFKGVVSLIVLFCFLFREGLTGIHFSLQMIS